MIIVLFLGIVVEIMGIRTMYTFIKRKINCTETVMGKIIDKSKSSSYFDKLFLIFIFQLIF